MRAERHATPPGGVLIPQVAEVVVVDDESTDATADVAAGLGARVVRTGPRPAGWLGKPWVLDQGIRSATSEWVVCFDADVRPDPIAPAALVAHALTDGAVTWTAKFKRLANDPSSIVSSRPKRAASNSLGVWLNGVGWSNFLALYRSRW